MSMDFNYFPTMPPGQGDEECIAARSTSTSSGRVEQLERQETLQVQGSEANSFFSTAARTETPMVPGGTETNTQDDDQPSDAELGLPRLTLDQLSPKAQYLSCRYFPTAADRSSSANLGNRL